MKIFKNSSEYFFSKGIYFKLFFIFAFFLILKIPTFNLAIKGDIETYAIIANNFLNGDFSSLNENKPPLLYLSYMLIIFFSKNNLLLFNILSSLPILIGAILLYHCCENRNKILAPIIYIFSSTYLIHGGKNLQSEHIVIIPIIISYLLLKNIEKENFIKFFLVGVFISIAIFIRQNISILYIGILFYLLINYKNFTIKNIIFYLFGSFIVTVIIIIFFFSINELNFLITTFLSPLYLPNNQNIFADFLVIIKFGLHILNFEFDNFNNNLNIFNSFSLYFFSFYVFLIIFFKQENKLLIVYIVSISLSIFLSRLPNTHYLIQIIPFLSILIHDFKFNYQNFFFRSFYYLNIIFMTLVVSNLYLNNQYRKNIGLIEHQFELRDWIINNLDKNDNIYLHHGHLIYNYIPQKTLTNFAHPNNIIKTDYLKYINKDKFYSSKDAWKKIKDQKPKFIVTFKNKDLKKIIKRINQQDDAEILYDKSFELNLYRVTPFSYKKN